MIAVEYLRLSALQRLAQHILAEAAFQVEGDIPAQDVTAVPIQDRDQIDEALAQAVLFPLLASKAMRALNSDG